MTDYRNSPDPLKGVAELLLAAGEEGLNDRPERCPLRTICGTEIEPGDESLGFPRDELPAAGGC